jgi:hypothetical protein
MRSLHASRRITVILVGVVIGLVAAFTQYVHQGYLGVVEGSRPPRLLGRGLHIRAPWRHVVFYPIRGTSIGIKTMWEGPSGKIKADVTLDMSVCRDSVASLHTAYGGEYIEALVVPRVNEFLRLRGDAWGDWQKGSDVNAIGKNMVMYLNASLASRGITVYDAWLRSFEVSSEPTD